MKKAPPPQQIVPPVHFLQTKTGLDFRTGLQSTLNYQRYGLLAGFWIGHSNYYKGMIGADLEAYSKLIRLGITYRLNK